MGKWLVGTGLGGAYEITYESGTVDDNYLDPGKTGEITGALPTDLGTPMSGVAFTIKIVSTSGAVSSFAVIAGRQM